MDASAARSTTISRVPDVACWHAGRNLDHLVVESSGVADPLPIVLTFLRPEFRNRMRIDSIVSIADAESFSLDLFASRPARNQFVYADVMLLNKCDLVGADRVGSVEEQIRNVADRARIVRTTRCRVPLPLILSAGLFQSDRYLTALTDPVPDGDRHRHDEAGRPHLVDDGFESISFAADRPFAVDKFQRFLEQLPDNVFVQRASCGSTRAIGDGYFTSWARDSRWTRAGRPRRCGTGWC